MSEVKRERTSIPYAKEVDRFRDDNGRECVIYELPDGTWAVRYPSPESVSFGSEPIGCGISWLWILPENHPFMPYCEWHDLQYDYQREGAISHKSSKWVDAEFLRGILSLSPTKVLKAQAYLFYGLARLWGMFKWPKQN